jgi:hypothetical protein
MKIPFLFSLILIITLTGCDKPNPAPETLDPIYLDMTKMAEEVKKNVEKEKSGYEGLESDLAKAKPQTGEAQLARRRLRESGDRLNHIQQMQKYWEIRADSRKDYDRKAYLFAWKAKTPWPDPDEYKQYNLSEKAQQQKKNWDVRARMKEAGVGSKPEKAAKKEGEEGKEEKPEKKE